VDAVSAAGGLGRVFNGGAVVWPKAATMSSRQTNAVISAFKGFLRGRKGLKKILA
jgi:hypothetical protein